MGCDKPFKTGGPVIEADIDGMKPTPPAVLEPVKDAGKAIRESVIIIGGVDGSCEEGEKGEEEKRGGEEAAKGEGVLGRSAGGKEANLSFVKSGDAKEFLKGSAVEKPDRCEKKSVDGEIRGCVENTKVAKNPTSGGTGGGIKQPDFEAERHA